MRIIRFLSAGRVVHGVPVDDKSARVIQGDILGEYRVTDEVAKVDKLLAPITPKNILCIGLNYREHAKESGAALPEHPVLFIKNSAALNNPFDPIQIPAATQQADYEAELAIVIGKPIRKATRANALDNVLGYTAANDVSARDWQRNTKLSGGQWCLAKSFDTFCPLGPVLVTRDELGAANNLGIRSILNGKTMQSSNTSDMIFDIPTIIEKLSALMTLEPGTVILTGTPQGVGFARTPPVFLKAGDTIRIEIDKIGALENPVV